MILNIYKNTKEMLYQRGYDILPNLKNEEIINLSNDKKLYFFENGIFIFFADYKFGTNEMNLFLELLNEEIYNTLKHIIIITENNISSKAKDNIIEYLKNKNIEYENFIYKELMVNLPKHILYQPHRLLTENEKNKIYYRFGKKLPYIKITDKMSKYFNAKIEDIFEIRRYDEDTLYYRMVVP